MMGFASASRWRIRITMKRQHRQQQRMSEATMIATSTDWLL